MDVDVEIKRNEPGILVLKLCCTKWRLRDVRVKILKRRCVNKSVLSWVVITSGAVEVVPASDRFFGGQLKSLLFISGWGLDCTVKGVVRVRRGRPLDTVDCSDVDPRTSQSVKWWSSSRRRKPCSLRRTGCECAKGLTKTNIGRFVRHPGRKKDTRSQSAENQQACEPFFPRVLVRQLLSSPRSDFRNDGEFFQNNYEAWKFNIESIVFQQFSVVNPNSSENTACVWCASKPPNYVVIISFID